MHRFGDSTAAVGCQDGQLDDCERAPHTLSNNRFGECGYCAFPPLSIGC
jgi:hypothetical protein